MDEKPIMRTELMSLSRSSLLRGFIAFFTSLKRSSVWISSAKMLVPACCKLVWNSCLLPHQGELRELISLELDVREEHSKVALYEPVMGAKIFTRKRRAPIGVNVWLSRLDSAFSTKITQGCAIIPKQGVCAFPR